MNVALRAPGSILRKTVVASCSRVSATPRFTRLTNPHYFRTQSRKMHIISIPMWTGIADNYCYVIVDDKTRDAMVVDPANPLEVLPVLREQVSNQAIRLKGVINTHYHSDHAGGNRSLLDAFPSTPIIGGRDCECVTKTPAHEEKFEIGEGITVTALHTPCHTRDSICYFVQDRYQKAVFTGDTLFIAGCGRFFEGTPEEMHKALNITLASLPDDTKVYPGHEYTRSNAKFGLHIAPNNRHLRRLAHFCEENEQTQGNFTIGDEKKHNIFMRLADPEVQLATQSKDPIEIMRKLREQKNNFSG